MPINCPECNTSLPDHDGFQYRFCPSCGTGITFEGKKIKDTFRTLPPEFEGDFKLKPTQNSNDDQTESDFSNFSNQTLAPQQPERKHRLDIKPPSTPPPPSFFRKSDVAQAPMSNIQEQTHSAKNRQIFIFSVLGIGGLIILAGILYLIVYYPG